MSSKDLPASAADADDALALESQLCFALYLSSQLVTGLYRNRLEEHGLTFPQYLVLLAMLKKSPIALGELSCALSTESSALSPVLKRMQVAGLLDRWRDAADERRLMLKLTAKGEALRAVAAGVRRQVVCDLPLDAGQISALRQVLQDMNADLLAERRDPQLA